MSLRPRSDAPARRRLLWTTAVALTLVVVAPTLPGLDGQREGIYRATSQALEEVVGARAINPVRDHGHDHSDPTTKNAISRAGESIRGATDPTNAADARTSAAYVARDRRSPAPKLRKLSLTSPRTMVPRDRFAMANGCYALQAPNGRWLRRDGNALVATAAGRGQAERFLFRATDLGTYLLYSRQRAFVGGASGRVLMTPRPATTTEWSARRTGRGAFALTLPSGQGLRASGARIGLGPATPFRLRLANGCVAYPEAQVNISGRPHGGVTNFQEVRGYVDAHVHHMAYEFLGGRVHCGKPWHPYGAEYALVDCLDHTLTGGTGAVLETVLSGSLGHDPVGWPTFKDWPAPDSLTHEGTYYKWVERSWRGGLRIFVNLLVENGQLCNVYPLKKNSCDDMDSVRLQAQRMREFERYVDAQYGGPGKGWYRIVTSPWQARKAINQGKLAVVMGIETSVPFGCSFTAVPLAGDVPACDRRSIDRQLDEMHRLGVRQMELVNKFDNALAGVAGDAGEVGIVINGANFLETGTFWDMRRCTPADGESADQTQLTVPDISAGQQDALFGAVGSLGLTLPALPLYPQPMHCNQRGLTDLGTHLIDRMIDKKMLIDPDHMSVKARQATLTQLERRRYPGAISSHSWSTPDAYPRIYKLGGFVAPYAGDAQGFFEKWQRHLGWADPRFFFGFGFGADINGLGAQGNPRGAGVPNKVTYPFRGINGITVGKQVSGQRVYDINVDGVAHYGLYPDWIEDLRRIGGARDGAAIVADMSRGPEAYLQTWERAEGLRPDSCRNPGLRVSVKRFNRQVRRGLSTRQVMNRLGQPYARVGRQFHYCAKAKGRAKVEMRVVFTQRGKVARAVRRGA